jgi:hypothetical protein
MDGMAMEPRFPVDYESIDKDHRWGPKEIERITGERHKSYPGMYKVAAWLKELTANLWAIGKRYTVRYKDGYVCVLNDTDALHYNILRFRKGWKDMQRAVNHLEAIDTENLSAEDIALMNKRLPMMRVILAEMRAAQKQAGHRPIVYQRKDPPRLERTT